MPSCHARPDLCYHARMAGIVFVRTADLARIRSFYTNEIGMEPWVAQPDIDILRHGNLLAGFVQSERADTDALLTFFYRSRDEVDAMYARLRDRATTVPEENERYRIYNFFAADPDGRRVEFQTFLHELPEVPAVSW